MYDGGWPLWSYWGGDNCGAYGGTVQCVAARPGDWQPDPNCIPGYVQRCVLPAGYNTW